MHRAFILFAFVIFTHLIFSSLSLAQYVPKEDRTKGAPTQLDSINRVKYAWGKISEAEKNLDSCAFDPDAPAIVLYEKGILRITKFGGVRTKLHRRIKILNENGKDQADIVINLFAPEGFMPISGLKAHTINTDENGDTTLHQIEKKDFYYSRKSDQYLEVRFTFPNVEVGSIIEYSYNKYSRDFLFPEGWYFQDQIPMLRSEFEILLSNDFEYNVLYQGETITNKYDKNYSGNVWILEDIPAFKDEPF
ncbi:MAG: DUF3857 domain-containing protein, partial [Bacteroidota bacterium]